MVPHPLHKTNRNNNKEKQVASVERLRVNGFLAEDSVTQGSRPTSKAPSTLTTYQGNAASSCGIPLHPSPFCYPILTEREVERQSTEPSGRGILVWQCEQPGGPQ